MVSIIIVNYNTPDLVAQAVSSVYKYLDLQLFEVIVVDNASTKGSIENAMAAFPEVILIKSEENLGFGRANNLGYQHAQGTYILLLNSDAYLVDSSSIPMMMDYLEKHEHVGIVGPNFIKKDGSQNYAYGNLLEKRKIWSDLGINKLSIEESRIYATYKVCDKEASKEVGYLAAAGILIKSTVIKELGLFDPHIFLYYEDMELGWRYSQHNYSSVLIPEATIVHLGGGSGSSISQELQQKISDSKSYYIKKRFGAFFLLKVKLVSFFLKGYKRLKRRVS
ncbi:MAG: glycosyltransferase family 2 protein [Nonlabens sp.]|uniref:glycosyltransferase family 2 protein n=1 Tax=Nonlabens sp. TaxID=1888209 RepID=UPI003EF0A6C7